MIIDLIGCVIIDRKTAHVLPQEEAKFSKNQRLLFVNKKDSVFRNLSLLYKNYEKEKRKCLPFTPFHLFYRFLLRLLILFPAIRTVAFYGGNFAHFDRFSTEIFFAINRCVCLFFACSFASYLETHHSMHYA